MMGYTGIAFTDIESLCKKLGVSSWELNYLANHLDQHVIIKNEPKKDGSLRYIFAPSGKLKVVQRRIKDELLQDFIYPEYVYGLGGSTLRTHALVHQQKHTLVNVDLRDFFPSITHDRIYSMWIQDFGFSPIVARILTRLTTCRYKLQQGFPTSSHLATIIAIPFNDCINDYCKENQLAFSQYVDDINISGTSPDLREVFKLTIETAHAHNFSIKRKKTQVYNLHTGKYITGVALVGNRTRAPRDIRKKAIDALKLYANNPGDKALRNKVLGYAGFLGHLNKGDGKKYKQHLRKIDKLKETYKS